MKKQKVIKTAVSSLPTKFGRFKIYIFKCTDSGLEHTVLTMGNINGAPVLTRLHSQCLTGDTLFSKRCDCGQQLHKSLQIISKQKRGVLIYLNQEGRGIGLTNKIKAYALQDMGLDTVEANEALGFLPDERNYASASAILASLGVRKIILISNNPDKEAQLLRYGTKVINGVPVESSPNAANSRYLKTKKNKMGHRLTKV